jgi:hypothetical protein
LGFEVRHVDSRRYSWLGNVLHIFFLGVQVVYVGCCSTAVVSYEVSQFSAVEAWPLGVRLARLFLLIVCSCNTGISVVCILSSVIGHSGA